MVEYVFFIVQDNKKLLACAFFLLGGEYWSLDPTNLATVPLLIAKNPVRFAADNMSKTH